MPLTAPHRAASANIELDAIDLRIIDELQRDAKLTNAELATRVHLSPSPCLARVRALEQSGVVDRYVALVDARMLGLDVTVFIHITLDKQIEKALETFEQSVRQMPEVLECYLMTGDHDYILRVVVTDVQTLQHLIVNNLARIPGVANIRSSFALKQVKYETALPLGSRGAVAKFKTAKAPRKRSVRR